MSEFSTEPYKGVRDFYPHDWRRLTAIFATLRSTLSAWGYEEYQASPLERAELYETKTSEEIVSEQTYTFIDRGDRRVTLRPEMTPTLARMVAHKRRELAFPLRWYSVPNVFRYERPQKGRLREHYQLNVDLVGLPAGEADLEIITLASELLRAFGANDKDFVIRINARTILNDACAKAGLSDTHTRAFIRLLDKRAKMTSEAFEAARARITHIDPLTLVDTKEIETVVLTLRERGVTNVVYDPGITRGFDYYTGLVFEIFDTNQANPRSLFGGGRYDGLVGLYGGEPIPAIGFGMGDVTLGDFLETHKLLPQDVPNTPQVYVGTPESGDVAGAQALARELRRAGCRVFVNLTTKSLGDQIKDALKRDIPLFVPYGANEQRTQTVQLKVLASSEVVGLPVAELASRVQTLR